MSDWDQFQAVPTTPTPTQPTAGGGWDQFQKVAPPEDPAAVHPAITNLVKNAPGMKEAQNPWEGFLSGLQMSSSVLPFRKPDMSVPANAGFYTKLSSGIGMTVGDLPAATVGFFAGAGAGGAAGAAVPAAGETGTSEAGGAVLGAGAGTTALPQAIRETMMDYYADRDRDKSLSPMTAGDFFHQVATSSWNVTKAGVIGMVGGKLGSVAGSAAGDAAANAAWGTAGTTFAKTGANAAGFTAGATAAQGVLDRKVPDAQDFAMTAITALGFGVAGHYVEGVYKLNPQGEQVVKNAQKIYAESGVPPWEQNARAASDPKLKQELLTSDVNGDPNPTKFNQTRQEDPEPFHQPDDAYKVSAGQVAAEHEKEVSGLEAEGTVAAHVTQLLPLVKQLETGGMKNPDTAISPTGAIGAHQVQPGTARQYGFDPAKLMDPAYNKMVASTILADLSRRFHGDTEAVLAAYNAGPGRAMRFLRDGRDTADLPYETQKYLARAGFGGKGGEPPEPPEKPPNPEGIGPDYAKLSTRNLVDRFTDKVGEQPAPKVTGVNGFMRMMVSELESARGIDKELQKRGMLDPDKDLSTEDMFRQTYASDDRANYMFLKGNIDPITLDAKEGPAMTDVMKDIAKAGGNIDEYNAYRVAMRTLEKHDQGINLGVLGEGDIDSGAAEAGAIVQKPEMQKYKAIDEKMQQWKNGVLEYGRDSGLWDDGGMEAMKAMNTSHVSIRAIQNGDFGPEGSAVGNFKVRNPLRRMVGGPKGQIVDPLVADMDNARRIIAMADRNRAIGHVVMSQDHAEFWGLKKVGEVPKATIAEPGSDVFKPYGLTDEEAAPLAPFATRGGSLMDPKSFLFVRDGKGEIWQAKDPNVAQLMRGMDNPGEANWIEKIIRLPATLERAGITAAPDFAFRVPMAHQLSAWVMAPNHPPPYITALRGVVSALGKDDDFWELMRRGGLSGAITEGDMAHHVDKALSDEDVLQKTGALTKVWNSVAHPLMFAQLVTEKATQAERLGHWKMMKGSDTTPNKVAMQGRVAYLDFAEKGTWVVANKMAQYIPFWRASLLGTRLLRNAVVDHPGKFLTYAGLGIVAPQIALYSLNYEADKFLPPKDRYSSLPQWERDQFFITPPMGTDGIRIKLRRPYTVGPLINVPVERWLEATFEKNPNAFDGMLKGMFSDLTPNVMPQIALPYYEERTNYNFYTGQQLIPERVKEASPDLQYTDETSEISKRISSLIGTHQGLGMYNVSPIILDNYVQEWGGSVGQAVLHSLDKPLGKESGPMELGDLPFVRGFIVRNPRMGTQQIDDFYKEAANFQQINKDIITERKLGQLDQATADKTEVGQKAALVLRIEHALAVQRTALHAINERKDMTVDEQRQLSERIYNDAWQIARLGTRALRGENVTMDEAQTVGDQATQDVNSAVPNGQ